MSFHSLTSYLLMAAIFWSQASADPLKEIPDGCSYETDEWCSKAFTCGIGIVNVVLTCPGQEPTEVQVLCCCIPCNVTHVNTSTPAPRPLCRDLEPKNKTAAICKPCEHEKEWKDKDCGKSKHEDAGETQQMATTPKPEGKIIDGIDASPREYPYMVNIGSYCGGSIINKCWILTAAHCLYTNGKLDDASTLDIRTGSDLLKGGVKQEADCIVKHQYDPAVKLRYDIALIRLKKPIKFDADLNTQPICPPKKKDYSGQKVILTGWGYTDNVETEPDILQSGALTIWDDDSCDKAWTTYNSDSEICTTDTVGNVVRDICDGDSGGPVAVKVNGVFRQVGVVQSGGKTKCAGGDPAMHEKVSYYLNWIQEKLAGKNDCDE